MDYDLKEGDVESVLGVVSDDKKQTASDEKALNASCTDDSSRKIFKRNKFILFYVIFRF